MEKKRYFVVFWAGIKAGQPIAGSIEYECDAFPNKVLTLNAIVTQLSRQHPNVTFFTKDFAITNIIELTDPDFREWVR